MSNSKIIKGRGYCLHLSKTNRRDFNSVPIWECFDIDVQPGVKEVVFDDDSVNFREVSLKYVMKQFPDVEVLRIGRQINAISISNYMFPNTKMVYSNTFKFRTHCSMLVDSRTLINAFCKGPDVRLDLKGASFISPDALEGCRAKIIHGPVSELKRQSLRGYAPGLVPAEVGGTVCVNGIVTDIDEESKIIAIPKNIKGLSGNLSFPSGCTVSIDIDSMPELVKWKNFREKGGVFHELHIRMSSSDLSSMDGLAKLYHNHEGLPADRISFSENPYVTDIDGVVYTKDRSRLLLCPGNRTGKLVVPDGVKEIADRAFYNAAKIEEAVLPKSVESIGNDAFAFCLSLKKVSMKSVKYIGTEAFVGCGSLCDVNLGGSLKEIGSCAFAMCPKLAELSLPASVRRLKMKVSCSLKKINLQGRNLPKGLFDAVCTDSDNAGQYGAFIECEMSGRKFYIPRIVTQDELSLMEDRFELLGDTNSALDYLYQHAHYNESKYLCAIATYRADRNPEVKKYLSRVAPRITEMLLEDEEELIEFLMLGAASENTLKNTLNSVRDKNYHKAEAYIANALKNGSKKSFRV